MFLRLAGALAVLASTAAIGHWQAQTYVERPRQLQELIASLRILETEIDFGLTPLPEAFSNLARRCRKPVSHLYRRAAFLMNSDFTIKEAWSKAVKELESCSSLNHEDVTVLIRLGEVLGRSDRTDQLRHLQLAIENLQLAEKRAICDRDSKSRLWLYFGWGTGICTVILLY